MSEVSNLLDRSRAQHMNYQRANRNGDTRLEKTSIQEALSLRDKAHKLDPEHEDSGWFDDVVPHESYIGFYDLYLREATAH